MENNNSSSSREVLLYEDLQSSLTRYKPLLAQSELKLPTCHDILTHIGTVSLEYETFLLLSQPTNPQIPESSSPRLFPKPWKRLLTKGFEIVLQSIDDVHDSFLCQSCITLLVQEILPSFSSNEVRQIVLDILPSFLDILLHMEHFDNSVQTFQEISQMILSSYTSILHHDENALLPILHSFSMFPLFTKQLRQTAYDMIVSSLPLLPQQHLPMVIHTMLTSVPTLQDAIHGVEALRAEVFGNHHWEFEKEVDLRRDSCLSLLTVIVSTSLCPKENMDQVRILNDTMDTRIEYLLQDGWMQVLERQIQRELEDDSSSDPGSNLWNILDLIVMLVLFQHPKYRIRVETLLQALLSRPDNILSMLFGRLLDILPPTDIMESTKDMPPTRGFDMGPTTSTMNVSWMVEDNDVDPSRFHIKILDSDKYIRLINDILLPSLFEMLLWLLQLPCHAPFFQKTYRQNYRQASWDQMLNGISDVMIRLCRIPSSIQDEIIECLLSMTSISFLQIGPPHLLLSKKSKPFQHPDARQCSNGLCLTSIVSINLLERIAKIQPYLLLPHISTIMGRIQMESILSLPSVPLDRNPKKNSFLQCSSTLITCPHVIHKFCSIVAILINPITKMNKNHKKDEEHCVTASSGELELESILTTIHNLLTSRVDCESSIQNSISIVYKLASKVSKFHPISFSQTKCVGILLATQLISHDSNLTLSESDVEALLIGITKAMVMHPELDNSLQQYHIQHSYYDNHPLTCIHGCHFLYSIAKKQNSYPVEKVFPYIKNILTTLQMVKFSSEIDQSSFAKKGSAILYENSGSLLDDVFLDHEKESTKALGLTSTFCAHDFTTSFWWTSSWYYPSRANQEIDYNLRQCQAIYAHKLLDIYFETEKKAIPDYLSSTIRLTSFQIPKWPISTIKLILSLDGILPFTSPSQQDQETIEKSVNGEIPLDDDIGEEHEFVDMEDSTNNISSGEESFLYELFAFDISILESSKKQNRCFTFEPATTDTLLKIGWSCAMSCSACAAAMKHVYKDLSLDIPSDSLAQSSAENKQIHHLLITQLAQFYDLKLRAELCVLFLKMHIQAGSSKTTKYHNRNKRKTGKKNLTKKKDLSNRNIIGVPFERIKKKIQEEREYFSSIDVEYLNALKNEMNFLSNCISKQFTSLLNTDMLWDLINILSNRTNLNVLINEMLRFKIDETNLLSYRSLQIVFDLHINLADHISKTISEHKVRHTNHFVGEDHSKFKVFDCNYESGLQQPNTKTQLEGLGYIVALTGVVVTHLSVVRRRRHGEKALLVIDKCTQLLSSLYDLIRKFLETTRESSFEIQSSTAYTSFQVSTEIVEICVRSIQKYNKKFLGKSKDVQSKRNDVDVIIRFFEHQLLEHCEEACHAAQLVDILFLFSPREKTRNTKLFTWKVLTTIYTFKAHEWKHRITNPPKALSYFIKGHNEQNINVASVVLALDSLHKLAVSDLKVYEQCAMLRHFLLAYMSLISSEESAGQIQHLFNNLRLFLNEIKAKHGAKRVKAKRNLPSTYIPGLDELSYPIFFEITWHMLIVFISLSKPRAKAKPRDLGPYKNLQDLTTLLSDAVSIFAKYFKIFPHRFLKSFLKSCDLGLKVIDDKIEECFLWRSTQPILSDEEISSGCIDLASVSFLQEFIDKIVLCIISIANLCNSIRKEAQKKETPSIVDVQEGDDYIDGVEGENWIFASNGNMITALDLRCENLISNVRTTCRRHNLIPPNTYELKQRKIAQAIVEDKSNSTRIDEYSIHESQKKKIVLEQPMPLNSWSSNSKHNRSRESNDFDKINTLEELKSIEKQETASSERRFSLNDMAQADSDTINSDSDSFGVIGEWGH